ncbi:ATP-binding protein [Streptomyces coeruleoprunus]|uniref:ATP-binding protein n=1 Tax=Streptomyces coeruleoprunus TaxID=285563 RepID=A0ABV9XLM2_9ACTN
MPFTVTPPWAYTLQLPPDPRGPGIARSTLRTVLAAHGMRALTAVAELLTSELVTNAYLHSEGPCTLRLRAMEPGRLRVSVWNGNPEIPPPFRAAGPAVTRPGEGDEHGRGLLLAELCADDFGAYPLERWGGKLLWAECSGAADAGRGR